jgi:hypothetical protein
MAEKVSKLYEPCVHFVHTSLLTGFHILMVSIGLSLFLTDCIRLSAYQLEIVFTRWISVPVVITAIPQHLSASDRAGRLAVCRHGDHCKYARVQHTVPAILYNSSHMKEVAA